MIRVYAYLAALAVVIGAMLYIDHRGYERGKMACQAERAANVEKVQQAIDLRDQRSADVRVDMLDYLRVTVPAIEIRTHDTIERIRTVYKTTTVPADCHVFIDRPDSVQADLDAARESANSRVSAMRHTTPVTSASSPGMAGDRPMGSNHDGPVRDSSDPPERHEQLFARSQG